MASILTTNGLTKKYGNNVVLNKINLDLKEGKILGLLGPNGSGKTTLLKLVAGLLKPTDGEIRIDGMEPSVKTKALVSFLPDTDFLYDSMKIKDAIQYYADFFPDFDQIKAEELVAFMNLELSSGIKSLSKGMREKLNLSMILSRKARLYLLDEPLGGVDPIARDKILNAIIKNYVENSSMIISTHLVDYVEPILDEVVFLNNTVISLQGEVDALREERGNSIDQIYREVYSNDAHH